MAMINNDKRKQFLDTLDNLGITVAEAFSFLPLDDSLREICRLKPEDLDEYTKLLKDLTNTHDRRRNCSDNEKGKALENIVKFLLNNSGGIFEVKSNLHTSTNEIDDLVILNKKGKSFAKSSLIDFKGDYFICECKNYKALYGLLPEYVTDVKRRRQTVITLLRFIKFIKFCRGDIYY